MLENILLLEILRYPVMTQSSGIRVYEDGLYRYMKGSEGWQDVWYFTDEEMTELRQAIHVANIPSLEDRYEAQQLVADGTTVMWQVRVEGKQYHIHMSPGAQEPALEKLYHTFSTLRKLSPESSHWQVWQPEGLYRKFTVLGSVNAVDALVPLLVAMFVPQSASSIGDVEVPPDTLLVKTDWITEEQTEQTRLYSDGRYIREVEGIKKEEMTLGADQVSHVVHSIIEINWAIIPDHIDTT